MFCPVLGCQFSGIAVQIQVQHFTLSLGQDGLGVVLPEYGFVQHLRQCLVGLLDGTEQAIEIPDDPSCNIAISLLRFLQYVVILFFILVYLMGDTEKAHFGVFGL